MEARAGTPDRVAAAGPEDPVPWPGPCDGCAFLRDGTSTAAQVAELVPPYARTAALQELRDIRKADLEQRATEEGASTTGARSQRLGHRPTGLSYCGEREVLGVWEDLVVKNPDDHSCASRIPVDHPGVRADRRCATCVHRVPPAFAEFDRVGTMLGRYASAGDSTDLGKTVAELWSEVRRSCEAAAVWELRSAYDRTGTLASRPTQLPWCRALSDEAAAHYVVGEVLNVGRTCPGWEAGNTSEHDAESDLRWQAVELARAALDEQQDRAKGQSASYNSLHGDVLAQLRYDHDQAAVRYLAVALRRLGLTETEADRTATQLQSRLRSAHAEPWRRGGMPLSAGAVPAQALHPPRTAEEVRSGTAPPRHRGGWLDTLLGLTVPPDSDPGPGDAGDAGQRTSPPAQAVPSSRPALNERMDPPSDGAILLTGLHVHPADPHIAVHLGHRDRGSLVLRVGRTASSGGRGAVVEAHDLACALSPGQGVALVDVHENLGGHWTTRGIYRCGEWISGRLLLGSPFPCRVGFLVDGSGRSGHQFNAYVQWLDGPR